MLRGLGVRTGSRGRMRCQGLRSRGTHNGSSGALLRRDSRVAGALMTAGSPGT